MAFGTNEFGSIGIDTVVLDRFHFILVVLDEINKDSKCYSISVYSYLHAYVCTNSGKSNLSWCPYISSGGSRIFKGGGGRGGGGIKEWMIVGVVSGECLEE